MNTCKHGNNGHCALCEREDAEHDAYMAAEGMQQGVWQLVERLRKRRILATTGPLGAGKSHAQLCWLTDHPDPDCAAAADEIERLRAELAEAVAALPQAVRNERERCARLADSCAADGSPMLHNLADCIRVA